MIEAKDVRIGNIVAAGVQIVTIAGIYTREIEKDLPYKEHFYVSGFVGDYYCFNPNDLEPTPLTEDWLTKLGFTKIQEGDMAHPEIWRITYCPVLVETNFDLQNRDPGEYRWFEGNTNVPLYYVHDLQNLFFALSGKELTIINL